MYVPKHAKIDGNEKMNWLKQQEMKIGNHILMAIIMYNHCNV